MSDSLAALAAPADRPILDRPVMDPLDGFVKLMDDAERYGLNLADYPTWEALAAGVESARVMLAKIEAGEMMTRLCTVLSEGLTPALRSIGEAMRPWLALMDGEIQAQAARERRQWQVVARRRR